MGWVAIAATVVSTVISAKAASDQANATAQANNYQAAVARNNQTIAGMYADSETQKGDVLAQEKQMAIGQRLGSIRAAAGGSGFDSGSESGLRLQDDTLNMGNMDVRTIRANAAKAAYGYRVQGLSYGAQASLDDAASRNAASAGNLAATGAIISGAASVSDKWAKYKQAGVSGFGDTNSSATGGWVDAGTPSIG